MLWGMGLQTQLSRSLQNWWGTLKNASNLGIIEFLIDGKALSEEGYLSLFSGVGEVNKH